MNQCQDAEKCTQEEATGWEHLGFDLPFNLAL